MTMTPMANDFAAVPDPFVRQFFQQALLQRGLAHAYLLTGPRMEPLYATVLLLAKILNCTQRPAPDTACGTCQNCRWIADNAHPAVMTISPLTHLDEDSLAKVEKSGKPLTQIAATQTSQLLSELALTSPYCRVVIMVNVEVMPGSAPADAPPSPADWRALKSAASHWLALRPLTRAILNETSANRMLKTLEEPPANTVFVFLSDSPTSLLDTIVSRCQTLPFTLPPVSDALPEAEEPALQWLGTCQPQADQLACAQAFEATLLGEAGLSAPQALAACQRASQRQWRTLGPQADHYAAYRQTQQALDRARRRVEAKTNVTQTVVSLVRELCR